MASVSVTRMLGCEFSNRHIMQAVVSIGETVDDLTFISIVCFQEPGKRLCLYANVLLLSMDAGYGKFRNELHRTCLKDNVK